VIQASMAGAYRCVARYGTLFVRVSHKTYSQTLGLPEKLSRTNTTAYFTPRLWRRKKVWSTDTRFLYYKTFYFGNLWHTSEVSAFATTVHFHPSL